MAIRTAGEARGKMDRASREIATGQRVSSARDDAATWTRANALRIQADSYRVSAATMDQAATTYGLSRAMAEDVAAQFSTIRETSLQLVSAYDNGGENSQTYARIEAQLLQQASQVNASITNAVIDGRNLLSPGDVTNLANGSTLPDMWRTNAFDLAVNADGTTAFTFDNSKQVIQPWYSNSQSVPLIDSVNGPSIEWWQTSNASMITRGFWWQDGTVHMSRVWQLTTAQFSEFQGPATAAGLGRLENRAETMANRSRQTADRLTLAAAQLTDADLGKASANLRQAETRQQLALQTVRQALDAYGAYAGGLLGNAQRTQRALA